MNRYDRYHIVEGPQHAEIRVEHTLQDLLKSLLGIGLTLGVLAAWAALGGPPLLTVGLAALGFVYSATSCLPLISATRFTIGDLAVEQISRFIAEGSRRWDQSEIDRVVIYEQRRWGGRGRPFAWQVVLISQSGDHFPGEFQLRSEETAREFARHLSAVLGTSMDAERGAPPRKVAVPL